MLTLEVIGALSQCSAFRTHTPDLERVKRIYLHSPSYEYHFCQVEIRARAAGRRDIADAIAHCLNRTRRLKRLLLPDYLSTKRGLWRLARLMRMAVLANSVE
jgi:hypothetical protein